MPTEAETDVPSAVYTEQVRSLFRQIPIALAVNFVNAALVAIVLTPLATLPLLLPWFISVTLVTIGRGILWLSHRHAPIHSENARRWARLATWGSLLAGLSWGIGGIILFPDFCGSIISQKIEASILTFEKSIPRSEKWERAMRSAYAGVSRLEENPPENISELRSLEANCAAAYFRSWVGMLIKWRGTSRRPIPDNWQSIGSRSSPYHLAGNRNAAHPVNAILNYAYAALESEIRIKAISEGYDPTIGLMHEGSDSSSKFVFDLMEPERRED
jgi:CRISPR associated protein Cas1